MDDENSENDQNRAQFLLNNGKIGGYLQEEPNMASYSVS